MGVLVAAGMMGGLALYLANISRQQHVTQRKAETGAELTGLHHRIIAVLYDGDACLKTLGEGSVLQNGPVAELLNKGGTPVVKTGEEIKRVLVVEKMEIQNITGTGQTKEAELKVKIKKLGVANAGMMTERVFGLTVELDSAGKISRCHHTLDSKEHGIKTAMCTEMGGEMVTDPSGGAGTVCSISGLYKKHCESLGGAYTDPPGTGTTGDQRIGTCDMNPPLKAFCESMGGSYTGPSATGTTGVQRTGTCDMNPPLQAFCESLGEGGTVGTYTPGTPVGTCKIDDIYVNLSGDTMTGDLGTKILKADSGVFSGNISAGGTVSAGGTGSGGITSPGGTGGPGGTPIPPGGTGGPGGGIPNAVADMNCGADEAVTGFQGGTPVCTVLGTSSPTTTPTTQQNCIIGYTDKPCKKVAWKTGTCWGNNVSKWAYIQQRTRSGLTSRCYQCVVVTQESEPIQSCGLGGCQVTGTRRVYICRSSFSRSGYSEVSGQPADLHQ